MKISASIISSAFALGCVLFSAYRLGYDAGRESVNDEDRWRLEHARQYHARAREIGKKALTLIAAADKERARMEAEKAAAEAKAARVAALFAAPASLARIQPARASRDRRTVGVYRMDGKLLASYTEERNAPDGRYHITEARLGSSVYYGDGTAWGSQPQAIKDLCWLIESYQIAAEANLQK